MKSQCVVKRLFDGLHCFVLDADLFVACVSEILKYYYLCLFSA